MPAITTRECSACKTKYDLFEHMGEWGNLDQPDGKEDDLSCPKCAGTEYRSIVALGRGIELGDEAGVGKHYPRYDRGLQCIVKSAAHRRQLCKERGLVPVDGDVNLERSMDEQIEHNTRTERYAAYQDKLKNAPEFAGFRRYMDTEGKDKAEARKQALKRGETPKEYL